MQNCARFAAAVVLVLAGCVAGEIGFVPGSARSGDDAGEAPRTVSDAGFVVPPEEPPAEEPGAGTDAGWSEPDLAEPEPDPMAPGPESFRFVACGDTKDDTGILAELSPQVLAVEPRFTLYAGDLVPDGFDASVGNTWKDALDGWEENGLFDITFAMRGNHERAGSEDEWAAFFDLRGLASRVGARQYTERDADRNFSFDYGNAHFVSLDVLGSVGNIDADQLAWMDQDLAAAEARGLTHAFLSWHGPVYPVANHCCDTNEDVTDVINRHPIVSATFHGHEHTHAWVHVDDSRIPGTTHEFEEFVVGAAGAGPSECADGRTDYCQDREHGFALVTVSGRDFTVDFHVLGQDEPVETLRFTKPEN